MYPKLLNRTTILIFLISIFLPYYVLAESGQQINELLSLGERVFKQRSFHEEEKSTVYLTFDDGPTNLTSEILDILGEENIKVTFFVLGQSAKNNPTILKRIVDEGHAIGNHSYTHQYKKIYSSFTNFWTEVQKTEEVIYNLTGIRTSLVRAPGGTYKNWDSFYFYYLDQANYLPYDWNVDSGDSKRKNVSTEEIVANIKGSKLANKLIVLVHDGWGHKNTVEALPSIIKYYRDLGYRFEPLSEKVEPIIQPRTISRWARNDEFELRNTFVRNINEDNDSMVVKKMTDLQKRIDYETEIVSGKSDENRKVDMWVKYPYHRKLGDVIYDYKNEESWISLNQLQDMLDISVSFDNENKLVRIKGNGAAFNFWVDQPFQIKRGNELLIYQGLKSIDKELYVPMIPILQAFNQDIYWNQGMSYLLWEQKYDGFSKDDILANKFDWTKIKEKLNISLKRTL